MESSDIIESAVAALEAGELVVIPTDTVYGLAAAAAGAEPARRLYRLKGRDEIQPTALMSSSVDVLLECIPELRGRMASIVRALLPGPFTLVIPNPATRFGWLSASRPEAIGVRVPTLAGPTAEIIERLGVVVATSANLPGGPDPRLLDEVPEQILTGVAVALDGGELPGTPSTVIDLTGSAPEILRPGAGDPAAALARIAAALT
jgi:L-threonylcarbamoyladenylate synthase